MLYHNPEIADIDPDYEFSYFIKGDTLIAGRECKKFYGYNEKNDGLTLYKLALFEEDDKVYFIPVQSEEHYVLYDFSDSFQETTTVSWVVHPGNSIMMRLFERKTVNINGTERLCLHLNRQRDNQDENFWDFPTGWWIQGVGSILGPLNNWGFSNSGNSSQFISCELNGETIYTASDFMERFVDDVYLRECIQQTGFNLFNLLSTASDTTDNLCFSPLSAQLALSMVANGADGSTLKEIHKTLGIYGYSSTYINSFNQMLLDSLTVRPPFSPEEWKWWSGESDDEARMRYDAAYPVCEIANSLWHRPDVMLYDSFTDILKWSYDAGTGSVDFDTEEGIGTINSWVYDKTHGMIPKIYEKPQPSNLAVVLANALYFKGSWSEPFDSGMTQPGVFHCSDGAAVKTDMMCSMSEYPSAVSGKFRMLTLSYGRGDYSMTLFVPIDVTSLPKLTIDDWRQTMTEEYEDSPRPYAVYLPKFDFDGKYDLKPVLMNMGMNDAFDSNKADFTKMYADHNRAIDKVFQLSRISVDEEGTEASAVTVIEMPDCAGPDPDDYEAFRVDRPFYFTIENRKEQSVLFVGRVATLEGEAVALPEGDLNGDNKTDISDVVAIINVMAGTDTNDKSDVNGDGKTDISDITAVINIMAGIK